MGKMDLLGQIQKENNFQGLSSVLELCREPVLITEINKGTTPGKIVFANKEAMQLTGLLPDDPGRLEFFDIVAGDGRDKFKKTLESLNKKDAGKWVGELIKKSGDRLSVTCRITSWEHGEHSLLALFITESGAQLQPVIFKEHIDESYMTFINHLPFGLVIHQGGKVVFINKNGLEMIGAGSEKEILGTDITKFVHPEYREETINRVKRLLNGEKGLYPARAKFIHMDGSFFDVLLYAEPITFNDQPAVQVAVQDITKEIKTLIALEETEERYKQLVENSPDAIVIHQDEKIVFANQATVNLSNAKSVDEILGKGILTFVHPDSQKSTMDRAMKLARGEEVTYPAREKYLTADGITRDVEVSTTRIIFKNKPAYQVMIRDITEKVNQEEKLQQYSKGLEKEVEQRTKELHNQKEVLAESQKALTYLVEDVNASRKDLEIANRNLQAVNRELESFSYSVSHDLRAPLRRIDGFVNILMGNLGDKIDEEEKHYFDRISVGCREMGELIEDLLNLSRITTKELRKPRVDLTSLCYAIIKELEIDPNHKISVQDGMTVEAEPTLLEMMMTNLLSNSIKYCSKTGDCVIEIGSKLMDGKPTFFVKDNGVGFNMKYYDKLFQPFQRLHPADQYPGTGIGLATVNRIVNKHSGEIWAESVEGEGAVFYFRL